MENHKKMYAILCRAVSDALDILPYLSENLKVRLLLEKALLEAEEIFIDDSEEPNDPLIEKD